MAGGELIPICFFLGLSAGVIGKIKGSSFLLWFLIGALTLGFGILAALLHRVERNEPLRRCPTCNNLVALSHQVCMRCGEDLDGLVAEDGELFGAAGGAQQPPAAQAG